MAIGLAVEVDVVGEAAGAGHQPLVLLAAHRLADAELIDVLACLHEPSAARGLDPARVARPALDRGRWVYGR